jgi:site-specific recombinase XerD
MDRGGAQKVMKMGVAECGIRKEISIHSLRHYAQLRIMPNAFTWHNS